MKETFWILQQQRLKANYTIITMNLPVCWQEGFLFHLENCDRGSAERKKVLLLTTEDAFERFNETVGVGHKSDLRAAAFC